MSHQKSHPAVGIRSANTPWGRPAQGMMWSPAWPGQHLSKDTLVTTLEPKKHPQLSMDSVSVTPETFHLPREAKWQKAPAI